MKQLDYWNQPSQETQDDIRHGYYLVVDDPTSDDEVHVITPSGMLDNFRRFYPFPVLLMCKGCLGPAIWSGESPPVCLSALHEGVGS